VAPGSDETLARLEHRFDVLPGTRRTYAYTRLVLIVPVALAHPPDSFEALRTSHLRLVVADPLLSGLGMRTRQVVERLGLRNLLKDRLEVAMDARGVLDQVLNGQALAGVVFSHEAAGEYDRVRVVAFAPAEAQVPIRHSIAMARHCPDRHLGIEFLNFTQTEPACTALGLVGYEPPPVP
jgi:molybdate transport system substrate-binding protein